MYHEVEIKQDRLTPTGTEIYIDGIKVDGVRSAKYKISAGEVPQITLEIIPKACNIDTLNFVDLTVDVDSLHTAIECIRLELKLNEDFRERLEETVHAVLLENGIASMELAKRLVSQVCLGE